MSRRFRLAVMRVRHDTSVATLSDDLCRHFAIGAPDASSVVDYWSATTRQYLDIECDLLPWYDVILPSRSPRLTSVDAAVRAAQADHRDVSGYDGYLVLVHPGFTTEANPQASQPGQPATMMVGFDGGAAVASNGRPACAIPIGTSNHTFACHELGHVVGYEHSWGLPNNGSDWDGVAPFTVANEYGDPYDIMSSAAFGSRWLDPSAPHWSGDPTFSRNADLGTQLPGWPNVQAWDSMGPELARAHLWFRDPDATRDVTRVIVRPRSGWNEASVLTSAGRGASRSDVQLLVLRPPGSRANGTDDPIGTYYVEYRGADGWDRGLHTTGSDLARRAVVLHQKADNGSGQAVIWYRGHVVVPVELDDDVRTATGDLVVSVSADEQDLGHVYVRLTHSLDRRVSIRVTAHSSRQQIIGHHPEQVRFLCGEGTYDLQTVAITATMTYTAESWGFGGTSTPDTSSPPQLTWVVGGATIASTGSGTVEAQTTDGRMVSVGWVADAEAATLQLTSDPSGGEFDISVAATVTESDGSFTSTSTSAAFHAVGVVQRFEDAYYRDQRACMDHFVLRFRPKMPPWPGPDPAAAIVLDEIRALQLDHLLAIVSDSRPDLVPGLQALVADLQQTPQQRSGPRRGTSPQHERAHK